MDHFCFSIFFFSETPIFIAFPATKLKTGVRFHLLDARFSKIRTLKKHSSPRAVAIFTQTPRLWENPKNILTPPGWPCPNDFPGWFPSEGSPRKTHTQKRAAKTWSRRNNIRTEQSRKDNPKMTTRIDKKQTRTHNKNTTQAETKKRKSSNKEDNESKECKHKRQVGPKEGCVPNTKHKKNKCEATKNPLLPQKIVQEHETKTCSVDKRNPPQKKETMILWKDIFARIPERQTKWFFLVHCFPVQIRAGGWGEEETQAEKEEE